jgi:hypothetical protein
VHDNENPERPRSQSPVAPLRTRRLICRARRPQAFEVQTSINYTTRIGHAISNYRRGLCPGGATKTVSLLLSTRRARHSLLK